MRVRMRYFAAVREAAGCEGESLELPEAADVEAARAALLARYPALAGILPRCAAALNRAYVAPAAALHDGDELAFIPPVGGGEPMAAIVKITREPLDDAAVAALERTIEGTGDGGVVTFRGIVRDTSRGKRVRYLEYDVYPEMAEQEMAKIASEVERRWQTSHVAMVHRIGRLEIGECSVVVSVACPHRGEAFAACRYAIDTLKSTVPIWKKEVADDGEEWVEEHASTTP